MSLALLELPLAFPAGVWLQRTVPGDRLRRRAWGVYFWTVTPALAFASFTTVGVSRSLGLALAAAILASWLVIALGWAYGRLVGSSREERGALALAAGFPNTGFLGYPLAQLAFGHPGLALMVIYDRLAWLVPSTAISTTIARLHGERPARSRRLRPRAVLANPPLFAALAAVALRAAGVDLASQAHALAALAGLVVGPAGFLLLGLALPLDRPEHDAVELRRASGALAIRFLAAPLVLLATGTALGADVPAVFYLAAAMPCAFHLVVLARVFDLRPQLVRLLVVASTVPAVAAVVAGTVLFR